MRSTGLSAAQRLIWAAYECDQSHAARHGSELNGTLAYLNPHEHHEFPRATTLPPLRPLPSRWIQYYANGLTYGTCTTPRTTSARLDEEERENLVSIWGIHRARISELDDNENFGARL
jgi:hypothetical protein